MAQPSALISELEDALAHGSSDRRLTVLRQVTDLFLEQSAGLSESKVDVFDDIITHLASQIEESARRDLSRALAPIRNAPLDAVAALARDASIAVAGPVLQASSRLTDAVLSDVARSGGQDHLMAISRRTEVAEQLTDILVARGDEAVARSIAGNQGARFSNGGFTRLAERSRQDDELATLVGARRDVPLPVFKQIISQAKAHVQQKLLSHVKPVDAAAIKAAIDNAATRITPSAPAPRDYSEAQRRIFTMHRAKQLNEASVREFAQGGKFEDTACAVAALCSIDLATAERLLNGETSDSIIILCRASGFMFETAKAMIKLGANPSLKSQVALDEAFASYEKLTESAAKRVVRFWQVRITGEKRA